MKMRKIVLMYHSISEEEWIYSVPLDLFKKHLELINTYPDRVVLTFDDAYLDIFHPLMELNILCQTIVFAPAQCIGKDIDGRKVMDLGQLRRLKAKGVKIGLHGLTHQPIGSLEHLEFELNRGKEILGDLLSEEFLFSFPNGIVPDGCERVLKRRGVDWAFSSEPGIWKGQYIAPRFVIRRSEILRELEAIVRFSYPVIAARKLERISLCLVKSLLGLDRYEKLKEFLLRKT